MQMLITVKGCHELQSMVNIQKQLAPKLLTIVVPILSKQGRELTEHYTVVQFIRRYNQQDS